MPIPRKSLREIAARRARADASTPVYALYMRISCIEMEKSRRELERRAARQRLAAVEGRLSGLEREKARLLATAADGASASGAEELAARAAPGRFRIRY